MEPVDKPVTLIDENGELQQVQRARISVDNGLPIVGIKTADSIVMLAVKKSTSRLQIPTQKIEKIDNHIAVAISGKVADARKLIARARTFSREDKRTYDEPIKVRKLAIKICDLKQETTQFSGMRPFCCSLMFAGENDGRVRLFTTNPSGLLVEYLATSIGRGHKEINGFLDEAYNPEMTTEEAVVLGLKALIPQTKDEELLFEIGIISPDGFKRLPEEEVDLFKQQVFESIEENI